MYLVQFLCDLLKSFNKSTFQFLKASLRPQDPRNLLSLQALFSGVKDISEKGFPARDPTSTSDSQLYTSSTGPVNLLTGPCATSLQAYPPEISVGVFRGGKPPLENSNTSIHL